MRSLLFALLFAPAALAAEVSGYVYTVDGRVVEGATVRAGSVTAKTDKDGGFVLRDLPEGVVELDVDGKAHRLVLAGDLVSITLTEEQSPAPSQTAQRGEGVVRGRVTVDGKPLANAPVLVGGVRAVTNAKGEYVATGLAADTHIVMPDERLFPRLRHPLAMRMYAEGQHPFTADLRNAREAVVNLELQAAPMIRGRVVDADGKPVARARVQVAVENRSSLDFAMDLAAHRTTPDGRYAMPAPDWLGDQRVNLAVTPFLHSTIRSKSFVIGDEDLTVDVKLPKLQPVRIRVVDRAGKPIPEARVAFASTADTATFESPELLVQYGPAERFPRANAEGELVVQLAADTYDFAASAEGFQNGSVTKAIAKPATVDVVLERAALLRGRVHRGDRGVPGVHVSVVGGRSATANAITEADGTFAINGLAPGAYRLMFFKEDELLERTLDVEAPGTVDVPLAPAGILRGRVIEASTGAPVGNFVFSVESVQSGRSRMQRGESSADGTFTVTVPAGSYRVTAGAANFTSAEPVEVRVVENETTVVDLPLGRGVTITGRVVDESGIPVAGADVMVTTTEGDRMYRTARVGPPHTQTAADGTFTVTGIETGPVQFAVRKQGFAPYRKVVDAGGAMSLDVTLTRGLSIQGIVTRGRRPVAGVQVGASSAAIGGEHQSAITDEDGRFTLSGLIAARYTVSAFHEADHTEVRDVDPTRQREIVLSLDPKPRGILYGVVTGIPQLAGAGKVVRRVVMVQSETGGTEAPIDDAGNYRIEEAPTGKVAVVAMVETASRTVRSSARREVELVAGQPTRVDLDLAGSVRVSGRVTVDGKPVVADVNFSSDDATLASTRTNADGTYELLLAAPGRYRIHARAEQLHDRFFQTVREIRGGEVVDIDLREQVIEGSVVDAVTRQPIANAIVTLAPPGLMWISGEVPTDANGRFRMTTTASGSLRLIAWAHGYAQRAMPLTAGAQPVLELSPVPDTQIRVLDARNGTPLDAHVLFQDETGVIPVRPRRSPDGTTYLFSLAPGKYRATAMVQGYETKVVEVTAPGTTEIRVE